MPINFKNPNIAILNTATTVYTCPTATQAVVFTLLITNIIATNTTVTVEVYDASTFQTRVLGKDILVPAANVLSWDGKIALEANDVLKLTAVANNELEVFASVMEKS